MTNVWYVKNILANCDGNMCLPILLLPRVELHCKLHEKLHRVIGPSVFRNHWLELNWISEDEAYLEHHFLSAVPSIAR